MNSPRDINLEVKRLIDQLWKDTTKWEQFALEGETLLLKGLEKWPDHSILVSNLGAIYEYQFNREKALPQLERAVELGANDKHTYFNIGVVKTNLHHSDARKFFELASKASSRDDTFHCYIDFQAL